MDQKSVSIYIRNYDDYIKSINFTDYRKQSTSPLVEVIGNINKFMPLTRQGAFMKKIFVLLLIFVGGMSNAAQVECMNQSFPANMGSVLRFNISESGAFGLIQLYYNDGETDVLKKTWGQYSASKLQVNQYGQGVYYLRWGAGSSTSASNPKHVPRVMSMYGFRGNLLRVGVFQQQGLGSTTQNTEVIFNYICRSGSASLK